MADFYIAEFLFFIGFVTVFLWKEKNNKIKLSNVDQDYYDRLLDIIYDQFDEAFKNIENSPEYKHFYRTKRQKEIIDLLSEFEKKIYNSLEELEKKS